MTLAICIITSLNISESSRGLSNLMIDHTIKKINGNNYPTCVYACEHRAAYYDTPCHRIVSLQLTAYH